MFKVGLHRPALAAWNGESDRPMQEPEGKIPRNLQPDPSDYAMDLDATLRAVVGLRAGIPADASTASSLGTERAGSGVVIRDNGLVLTMGYLIMEAESLWITSADGGAIPGHALAYEPESGFGLVQPLGRLAAPALDCGSAAAFKIGDSAILAAYGGRARAIETRLIARQEFAGSWEYVLDDALFTAPAHPFWGGAALIGADGRLLGIASLILQRGDAAGRRLDMNMVVPIDRLLPVLDDLLRYGHLNRPPRPWLGLYAVETEEALLVGELAAGGPAERAGLQPGDQIVAVGDEPVADLATLWRRVWASGPAGEALRLVIERESRQLHITVITGDRRRFLKAASFH